MKRLSYSNVVATIALVFALTGTAVAAGHYIITSSRQVKPGALGLINFSRTARGHLRGPAGPAGPQGAPGPQGAQGPAGSSIPIKAAFIQADGSQSAGQPGVTVQHTAGSGIYVVTMPGVRNGAACQPWSQITGAAQAGFTEVPLQGQGTGGWSYEVDTQNVAGSAADLPFSLYISCPS